MITFWLACLVLIMCAIGLLLPWLHSLSSRLFFSIFILVSSFTCYFYLGSSNYLKQYYVSEAQFSPQKVSNVQRLFTEFKKYEFKLRQRLEENPNDIDAEWRLLDTLAIKAMQNEEIELAKAYWESALKKLPEGEDTLIARKRILEALSTRK